MKLASAARSSSAPFVIGGVGVLIAVWVSLVESAAAAPIVWMPDVLVGLAFVVAAALAWRHSRATAWLLAAVAFTWFAGSVLPFARFWHRGPLVHILLRTGSRRSRTLRIAAIAAGYVVSLTPWAWSLTAVAIPLGVGLAVLALTMEASSRSRIAGALLGIDIAATAAIASAAGTAAALPALLLYDGVMIAVAVLVTGSVLRRRPGRVADLIVGTGTGTESGTVLRDALAQAVGDATLRVGLWNGTEQRFVPSPEQSPRPGRATTRVDVDGGPAVLLEHRADALDDPRLREAVASAVRMIVRNAELRALTVRRNAELEASRRRLVTSDDAARVALRARADDAVMGELDDLAHEAEVARRAVSTPTRERLADAIARIRAIRDSIDEAISGLAPLGAEQGLEPALRSLAARVGAELTVHGTPPDLPPAIATAVTLAAAEAITNAVKHAQAATIGIELTLTSETVAVAVRDDGVGGADAAGSGITGIADRISAIGGSFALDSPPGGGTRARIVVPLTAGEAVTASATERSLP